MAVSICPQVYQVGGSYLSHPDDCCVYLVESENKLALIDAGAGKRSERILENIEKCGFSPDSVQYILVTHGHIDHIGGLKYLQEKTGALVLAHQLELDAIENGNPVLTAADWYGVKYQPVKVDRVIKQDRETLTMGQIEFQFLHTPGHTPGSLSILCRCPDSKILFGQIDKARKSPGMPRCAGLKILFGQDIHGPFNQEWGSDLNQWRSSMQRLLSLEADILCEGHFGIYEPAAAVHKYIESYLRRYSSFS
ncbi:MAG: MBL fold metallo-hydrolase [Bacillota bacterium]|jgi:glyoxylase-like metal-dependent hydrolase (beta-lactamase superfamily II)